ncbi:MAG: SDR family oxidoreductase [Dehalococcoidia bacterium]|nr:SDR family oxidoreductase [Dehalococcoidia bacterium]
MPYAGLSLEGKNALVTGSARGIGRALAVGLAQAGANVAVSDTSERLDGARETQEMIEEIGTKSSSYVLDVLDVGGIPDTIHRVSEDLGGLDILVNNAGVRVRKLALEVTEDEWDFVVDTNLKGVFFCSQAAAKLMIGRGGGRIINIASQFAVVARADRAPYCASKGGVANLTKALALEWAQYNITVNAIGPGPTDTPGIQTAHPRSPEEIRREMESDMPLGRRMEPEELVGAAVYLASPSSVATTGHLLIVVGGWTAR